MAAIALQADRQLSERRRYAVSGTDGSAFKPLDPDVVSAAIPAFFIGRNRAGLWVARDANGGAGGLFLFRASAIEFARRRSAPARCALVFLNEVFELDIDNRGNPLVAIAGHWLDQARRRLPQPAAK
ncbi:hypothetical protein [Bradyrhizobium sp.]|uniref:hypothetical protein n=1 Tax=Bradyrhizobium sp. TaxID=376 RepID=UPI0039E2CBD1